MGTLPMKNDGGGARGFVGTNNRIWDEKKEVRSAVVGDRQGFGSSEEDESRNNTVTEDANNGPRGAVQVNSGPMQPQPLPQGPVVCWDRFLPIRSLKVLLVENDDSTRHVVSALLRNCSYEVTAVANGIHAWKILEDLTNHVDLVLTEVAMPFLSGIGLLCKIMSHKTFKNIPVIMMSSHDSMGIVFKCLSRGAVDFLVKPIRKNELKNLWQHVWRRCHSSSGSGSESGTQTRKSVRSKSNNESENNTASSDERDNGSNGLSIRDGSDNGSGTQSSWTKRAVEVDSPRRLSEGDQLTDSPDSTCALVIHTKPETVSTRWVHITETKECLQQDEQLDNIAMGKDLEIGISINPDELDEIFSIHPMNKRQNKLPELEGQPEHNNEAVSGKPRNQTANLIGIVAIGNNPGVDGSVCELPNAHPIKDKASCSARELPSLELSLKRLRGVEDVETGAHDEGHVLRLSGQSAFSKYNTASSARQAPTGKVGSCSPLDNGSVTMKAETVQNFPSRSNGTLPNQQSNDSSNNNDMGSTTKYMGPKPEALASKSDSMVGFKYYNTTSAFQPTKNSSVCPPQQELAGKAVGSTMNVVQAQPKGPQQQVQVQHHHHHYHHYHHHVHNRKHQQQEQQQQPDSDEFSLKNLAAVAPQCGSSNVFGGPVEGTVGNYSVNGSASGSNHGSNGQNGSSPPVLNVGVANIESDNRVAGNSSGGGLTGRISGNATDEDRFAQREAALTKFRQKRKERCFEKKVRYQSRKRLAEQRPRIRGQFVRQIASSMKGGSDSQNDLVSGDDSCDR